MNDTTLYFKDLSGLIALCYLRLDRDDYFDTLWVYEVIVKGSLLPDFLDKQFGGIGLHYLLARNTYTQKEKFSALQIEQKVKVGVTIALTQLHRIEDKIREDIIKLMTLDKQLKDKDEKNGK